MSRCFCKEIINSNAKKLDTSQKRLVSFASRSISSLLAGPSVLQNHFALTICIKMTIQAYSGFPQTHRISKMGISAKFIVS